MKIFLTLLLIMGLVSTQPGGVSAQNAQLQDIQTAILEEDFVRVKSLSEKLLRSSALPEQERVQVQYYLALSELCLQNHLAARKTFEAIRKTAASSLWREKALLGIIDSYYMMGDYRQALKMAQQFLKSSPDSELLSLAYLKVARANLRLSRWKEAHQYLEKILAEFPQSLEAHTAQQLLEEKQFFAVQVGSFLDQARAESLVDELTQKGEYAYIVETTDPGGERFYRVRTGKFSDLHQAESLKDRLSNHGYPTIIYP